MTYSYFTTNKAKFKVLNDYNSILDKLIMILIKFLYICVNTKICNVENALGNHGAK